MFSATFVADTKIIFRYDFLAPLRRLEDILISARRLMTKQDVPMMSGKNLRIYDILKTSDLQRLKDVQLQRLENV